MVSECGANGWLINVGIPLVSPSPEEFINTLWLVCPPVNFEFHPLLRPLQLVVSFILMCSPGLAYCYTWSRAAKAYLFNPCHFQIWEVHDDLKICFGLVGQLSQLYKISVCFFQSLFPPPTPSPSLCVYILQMILICFSIPSSLLWDVCICYWHLSSISLCKLWSDASFFYQQITLRSI